MSASSTRSKIDGAGCHAARSWHLPHGLFSNCTPARSTTLPRLARTHWAPRLPRPLRGGG
eukprot:3603633-Lingulodinium_polyedra.AAC.1